MRRILTLALSIALSLVWLGTAPSPARADDGSALTVLATTDIHGHLVNWDYFADQPYPRDAKRKQPLGLDHVSTIVKQVRDAKGADSVVVVDNGDYIQGTPLSYLAALQPGKLSGTPLPHAANLIGYDVQNLGNHEFNYGLAYLNDYAAQLNAPLLGANVIDDSTGKPAYAPTAMLTKKVAGHEVKVGVVGVVTTGVKVWDKAHVEGKLTFADPVTVSEHWASQLKADGADVVIVLAHMGLDSPAAPYRPDAVPENVASSIATKARNVDVVVTGHTHLDAPKTLLPGASGHDVLLSQAHFWARGVAEISLPLTFDSGRPVIDYASWDAKARYSMDVEPDPAFVNDPVIKAAHAATIGYVNSKVGTSSIEMTTKTSRYEDTPILDFIGKVQENTVASALKGTPYEGIPVITEVSPFSRTAVFPKGDLRIRDIAGLYVYDNTLAAIKLSGKQVREYLEWSARYFVQTAPGARFDPETGTNAAYDGGRPIPDYNFDTLSGVTYAIDVSKPVGERILGLSYQCAPVADDDTFIMAINNYRMSGAGAAPFVKDAPVVWNELLEIRQLLIDHATKAGVVDPKDFFVENWRLTTSGERFTPDECRTPTPSPTPTPGPGTPPPGSAPEALITVSPERAAVGAKLTVTGASFAPGEQVRLELHSTPVLLATVTADAQGRFTATLTVPRVAPGAHQVVATGGSGGRRASASLTVMARQLPKTDGSAGAGPLFGLALALAFLALRRARL
ncbi:MAG: 5'-nucleotidase C-terminal domain-containing protein [Propionibacteriaceae bacterium]|nr:5'-nucleotidase C-terminal domain-containing protein [Propionibacteriaceae bacterium]